MFLGNVRYPLSGKSLSRSGISLSRFRIWNYRSSDGILCNSDVALLESAPPPISLPLSWSLGNGTVSLKMEMWKLLFGITKPKREERFAIIRFRLATAYAFFATNGFIYFMYCMMKEGGEQDSGDPFRRALLGKCNDENTVVIKFDGFKRVKNDPVIREISENDNVEHKR